jgi:hypothetical protein
MFGGVSGPHRHVMPWPKVARIGDAIRFVSAGLERGHCLTKAAQKSRHPLALPYQ